MKKFFLIVLLFLFNTGCGYNPVYLMNDVDFTIRKISLGGNSQINSILVRKLDKYRNIETNRIIDCEIKTSEVKKTTSRDSSGNSDSFNYSLRLDIKITEVGKPTKNKVITSDFDYNKSRFKSEYEFYQYEKTLKNNLLDSILRDIELLLINN